MLYVLNGAQIQHLIDRFSLQIDLEDGTVIASRKNGHHLKASTVAKMVGLKVIPENWREHEGTVRGI